MYAHSYKKNDLRLGKVLPLVGGDVEEGVSVDVIVVTVVTAEVCVVYVTFTVS